MNARSRAEHFLTASGARAIAHPGGTLFEHLERTAALLESRRARPDLVLAGLCHASYGTGGFHTALLPLAQRETLRELIGPRAEELVYRYCSCDREFPATLDEPERRLLRDRFTGEVLALDPQTMRDFLELTYANELDVARHTPDPALRAALRGFLASLRCAVSDAAARAAATLEGSKP